MNFQCSSGCLGKLTTPSRSCFVLTLVGSDMINHYSVSVESFERELGLFVEAEHGRCWFLAGSGNVDMELVSTQCRLGWGKRPPTLSNSGLDGSVIRNSILNAPSELHTLLP